jgi:hypothetical protein
LQLTAGTCGVFQISHFQSGNRVIVSSLLTAASTEAGVNTLNIFRSALINAFLESKFLAYLLVVFPPIIGKLIGWVGSIWPGIVQASLYAF